MLQVLAASLYLVNKIFLAIEKSSGWLIGLAAAFFASLYFWTLELYILFVLEVGYLILMGYGYFNQKQRNKFVDWIINTLTFSLMVFLLITRKESGIYEFIVSISFILSIHFLARHRWNWGWLCLIFSHALMAYIVFLKNQYFFGIMQLASLFVAIYALSRKNKVP